MAKFEILVPFLLQWEGGLTRNAADRAAKYPCPTPYQDKKGWHTNKGVTYQNWVNTFGKSNDDRFFKMSNEDWAKIMKPNYWDKWKADQIKDQRIANTVVDWTVNSGSWGIKKPQSYLGVVPDGIVGNKTLEAINKVDPDKFLKEVYNGRELFFKQIAQNDKSQQVFLKGWLNRLENLKKFNNKLK